jgi:hypothetical protein
VTSAQTATASQNGIAPIRTVCPSGEDPPNGPYTRQPEGRNIRIVAGLGLVGGAIAAAFAIRKLRETSIPYDVPHCIGFLKVPFGCRSALAGILLLGGGFVPGLSELDSLRQILAYAVLLGYAQQVATRLIDKRAQTLMDAVPNKGSSRQTTRVSRRQPTTRIRLQDPMLDRAIRMVQAETGGGRHAFRSTCPADCGGHTWLKQVSRDITSR